MPAHITQSSSYRNVIYVCILTCIIIFSCKNPDTKKTIHPYENKLGIRPANLAQIDTVHYTAIEWIEPDKHFGRVKHGDSIVFRYRFKNIGDHPLFLYAAHPTCGCTHPRPVSESAIMPGDMNELTVLFNSNGQQGAIYKTVIVTSNTSNGVQHVLSFEGIVDTLKINKRAGYN